MGTVRTAGRRELTSAEILAELRRGNRVVIESEILGRRLGLAIRETDGTYYCDTPVTLLAFETESGLRQCLERFRLARTTGDARSQEDSVPN